MTRLQRYAIKTTDAPQPLGAYSQATEVQASRLVLVAGQVALDKAGDLEMPLPKPARYSTTSAACIRKAIFLPIFLLVISGLVREEFLVEIKAVAALP